METRCYFIYENVCVYILFISVTIAGLLMLLFWCPVKYLCSSSASCIIYKIMRHDLVDNHLYNRITVNKNSLQPPSHTRTFTCFGIVSTCYALCVCLFVVFCHHSHLEPEI